eukprot:TRINITY_DN22354_c0_g1_i1.p1 TRINITY_DN22354_c0_g1~~TRINITY_DN22354_c0_g1_i1.p1  ORF type:complete len:896 (-),score=88.86 TRINITY_DN22354_c0_g1_i1:93-2780(-)
MLTANQRIVWLLARTVLFADCVDASGGLTLNLFNNTALAGSPASSELLPALSVSLSGSSLFSAEVVGTFTPPVDSPSLWNFTCAFSNIAMAFVTIDGHNVCPSAGSAAAYNNSANGVMDDVGFQLLKKKSDLVVRMALYHLTPSVGPVVADVRWCTEPGKCVPLPTASLLPISSLPAAEVQRRSMQTKMMGRWGSWLHRDVLSVALLPDSAVVTVMLCRLSDALCLREAQIDTNGGDGETTVRVGSHALDHTYSQMFVSGPSGRRVPRPLLPQVNVSIEYTVNKSNGRELDLVVTPQLPIDGTAEDSGLADFAVVFAGSFAWGRVGKASATSSGLRLMGHGLAPVNLMVTAPPLPSPLGEPGPVNAGKLFLEDCDKDGDCASSSCIRKNISHGVCSKPAQLPHYAVSLASGNAVGITTRQSHEASLSNVQRRVAASRARQEAWEISEFGESNAEVVQAVASAVAWRNVYVPAEDGPVMPITYGFTWITPGPRNNDWKYILFCWDNIFASYIAGVLGAREAAYSNLIQIVKAKTNQGFVPNWAGGGSKSPRSEPAVASKVLLELFRRWGDRWLVELLFDDLYDWNEWQWSQRHVTVAALGPSDPGFITVNGGGESGEDQSPLWDCPGSQPNGTGGNCSRLHSSRSPDVLQLADVQSTSLFALDASALAALALEINRHAEHELLRHRASVMTGQLSKLWSPSQQAFADIYADDGSFSTTLTPNIFYPMLVGAANRNQVLALVEHLTNRSEFCVQGDFEKSNPANCYWGLPSVAANDRSYMLPPSYIYWRGLSWGPMTLLTFWSLQLSGFAQTEPAVERALSALSQQKAAMMISMWRRNRHICENYSPYAPDSIIPPGLPGKKNSECTGWAFHHWGALNGLIRLLQPRPDQANEQYFV